MREKCGLSRTECLQYHGRFNKKWDFHKPPTPDLVKQIKGLRKYTPLDIGNKHPNKRAEIMEFIIGYNQALDDVLNIIGGDGERNRRTN